MDSDTELTGLTETSGLKVTRRRCLEGSPSGAGGGRIIGAAGVARSETHLAGALSGLTVAVTELLGGVTRRTGDLELAGIRGVNPTDGGVVAKLAETEAEAKVVWA